MIGQWVPLEKESKQVCETDESEEAAGNREVCFHSKAMRLR